MSPSESLEQKSERLLQLIGSFRSCTVAFSGGVDSAVVAKAAHLALGDRARAVTGVSASLAEGELETAIEVASQIGIRHKVLKTQEFQKSEYLQNAPDRCYHCKTELYTRLEELASKYADDVILNGANADDAQDYRPGMKAAAEHRVRSPLLECGFTKSDVRDLAAYWQLAVWDKPASPCLSSRVAYGEEVTPERLTRIDRAEAFLRQRGFELLRVRYHRGDLARIEVPIAELQKLVEPSFREELVQYFRSLGFQFVTLDLVGFKSGSLNALLPAREKLVTLTSIATRPSPPSRDS